MSARVEFRGVRLGYGAATVLESVDLRVDAGELVTVGGPSGSGKSTLLLAVIGVLAPLSGDLRVRADVRAWVPQHERLDALHPVSVEEVAAAGVPRAHRGRLRLTDAARAEVRDALARLGLEGLAARPFDALSGGQRQRVLVARAVLTGADVLVLDEPTSALDDESAALVGDAIAREVERGAAVLCATHRGEIFDAQASAHVMIDGGALHVSRPSWT